jgi:hypothetical protein
MVSERCRSGRSTSPGKSLNYARHYRDEKNGILRAVRIAVLRDRHVHDDAGFITRLEKRLVGVLSRFFYFVADRCFYSLRGPQFRTQRARGSTAQRIAMVRLWMNGNPGRGRLFVVGGTAFGTLAAVEHRGMSGVGKRTGREEPLRCDCDYSGTE